MSSRQKLGEVKFIIWKLTAEFLVFIFTFLKADDWQQFSILE